MFVCLSVCLWVCVFVFLYVCFSVCVCLQVFAILKVCLHAVITTSGIDVCMLGYVSLQSPNLLLLFFLLISAVLDFLSFKAEQFKLQKPNKHTVLSV